MPKYLEKLFTTNTSSRRDRAVLALDAVVEALVDLVDDQHAALAP
jgi:hypothetical protein